MLLNQAPHTLDLLCYLAGQPAKVWGVTRTLVHAIEVEDVAQAMLEYNNGALGYIHINTIEAGARQRLEIVGDRAALELAGEELRITRFDTTLSEHRRTSPELFNAPGVNIETVTLPGDGGAHLAVYHDLQRAIHSGERPRADGREALMSLELANAIILSSFSERAINLPLDRAAYHTLLADLKAGEHVVERVHGVQAAASL